MTAIALRPAVAADAAAVATVLTESRRVLMPFLADCAAPGPSADQTHAWVRDVLIPAGGVTVAAWDATPATPAVRAAPTMPIGVLATARRGGCSWIEQFYVHPAHAGRGVGRTLLAQALATLPRPVQLFTFQPNTRARGFYERRGFVAVAFSDGQDNDERCPDVLYRLDGPGG